VTWSNWLFAGSLRADRRVAAIMSLIQNARLNGHHPYAYFTGSQLLTGVGLAKPVKAA
jgi:hypothetical protein